MHKCGCIVENILFMNKLYQDISVVIRDEFNFVPLFSSWYSQPIMNEFTPVMVNIELYLIQWILTSSIPQST